MTSPDYAYYHDTYLGVTIPEGDWPRLAARAAEQIDYLCRVYTVTVPPGSTNAFDNAICAVADAMYTRELIASAELAVDANGNLISANISIGSVSTSAKAPNVSNMGLDMTESGSAKAYFRAARMYLNIYRGVRACGC